jgi:hypothetical protein
MYDARRRGGNVDHHAHDDSTDHGTVDDIEHVDDDARLRSRGH